MTCPKCGSCHKEMKLSHDNKGNNTYANVYKCECSPFGYTGYELDRYWEKYQARLDKVLEKFEENINGTWVLDISKNVWLAHNENGFMFIDYDEQEKLRIISLKTVESILEDLERNE